MGDDLVTGVQTCVLPISRSTSLTRSPAILVQHHEADKDKTAGERVRDVEREAVHQRLLDTKRRSVPSRPSMSAAPRNWGTRKTLIFAVAVSNIARRNPATASLTM